MNSSKSESTTEVISYASTLKEHILPTVCSPLTSSMFPISSSGRLPKERCTTQPSSSNAHSSTCSLVQQRVLPSDFLIGKGYLGGCSYVARPVPSPPPPVARLSRSESSVESLTALVHVVPEHSLPRARSPMETGKVQALSSRHFPTGRRSQSPSPSRAHSSSGSCIQWPVQSRESLIGGVSAGSFSYVAQPVTLQPSLAPESVTAVRRMASMPGIPLITSKTVAVPELVYSVPARR